MMPVCPTRALGAGGGEVDVCTSVTTRAHLVNVGTWPFNVDAIVATIMEAVHHEFGRI